MKSKNITFFDHSRAAVTYEDVPELKENEVRVKAITSLISCGSETYHYIGDFEEGMHWASMKEMYPLSSGYTMCGNVIAIGNKVKKFNIGDRVYSRSPHKSICNVAQDRVGLLPDDISPQQASWIPMVRVADNCYRAIDFKFAQDIVILGLGVFGLMCVQYGKIAGARRIIAVDRNPYRCRIASKIGATHIINSSIDKCQKDVKTILGDLAECIIDATGTPEGLNIAGVLAKRMGKIALVSDTPRPSKQIVGTEILMKYLSVYGIHYNMAGIYNPNPFYPIDFERIHEAYFDYLRQGRIDIDSMISRYVSPEEACGLYDTFQKEDVDTAGIIIDWAEKGGER